ncbi:MAG: LicD family protein [Bacilli bacterium]
MKIIGLKEIQNVETKMLEQIDQICKNNNIQYYLRAGSLLGSIRHSGPIPWDTDIDIEVPINQYQKFYIAMKKNLQKPYKIYSYKDDKNYSRLFFRMGLDFSDDRVIHIDIFPMVGLSKYKLLNFIFIKYMKLIQAIYRLKKYSVSNVFQKRKLLFPLLFILKLLLFLVPNKVFIFLAYAFFSKKDFLKRKYVVNPFSSYGSKSIFLTDKYQNTIYNKYLWLSVPIPSGYNEILSQLYGDYNKFPDESYIEKKTSTSLVIEDEKYLLIQSLINENTED